MYNEALVRECFDANPKEEILYQTIDGQCFFKEDDARHHSVRAGGGIMAVTKSALPDTKPKPIQAADPKPAKKKS